MPPAELGIESRNIAIHVCLWFIWIFAVSAKLPGSGKRDGDSENHDDENIPTGDEGGDGGRVGDDDDDDFEAGGGEVESLV